MTQSPTQPKDLKNQKKNDITDMISAGSMTPGTYIFHASFNRPMASFIFSSLRLA